MRVKLCEKYKDEREIICKKLLDLLKLDANNSFLLCELEADVEKQAAIMALKEEIQKCFAVSSISTFKPDRECKRPYLNLVRGILRQQGYTFDCGTTYKTIESGLYKTATKYKVFRNN